MDGEGGVIFPDKVIPVKSASLVTDVNFTGQVMTVHPQRWTDDPVAWTKELIA